MSPLAMQHYSQAQTEYKSPLVANENACLGDVFSSGKSNPDKPMSCGFFRLEKGNPSLYTYNYDECKIIVEGSFTNEDETGKKAGAKPGDMFFFPNGAMITFTTEDYGLAFYTGQRKLMT